MKPNPCITLIMLFVCILAVSTRPCFGQENEAVESGIKIEDAVICLDVVDREPVGAGDVFPKDLAKLMCFTRITGATPPTEITHNWYFGDKQMASVALHVGSTNWRTHSSKKIIPAFAGEWKVEILAQDGTLLKRIYFIIEE